MSENNTGYQSLRGFYDILPEDTPKWHYVERVTREIAESYGYGEIRIPTLEHTGLFQRSVGDTTDIVQKEMYTFYMGDTQMTMRPEGTAGVARAVLEHGLLQREPFPYKLQYTLSCFRHEAPQAGRQREFHQFGLEAFGATDPEVDAEIMALVMDVMDSLGIQGVELYINSIGCPQCRPAYNEQLKEYYRQYVGRMCDDCKNRIDKNPLRLLDCKEESCQIYKEDAPRIVDHLCQECEDHFAGLKDSLEIMDIPYHINPDIVRGLDYYTKTVFEFITTQIGAQGTICGGGRYDGLLEELGGESQPGIGFGMGLERLIMTMEACGSTFPEETPVAIYIGSVGTKAKRIGLNLGYHIRQEGFCVLSDLVGRSVRAQMKYADRKNANYSCIIGDSELEKGQVEIRNMKTGENTVVTVSPEDFIEFLYSEIEKDLMGDGNSLEELVEKEEENKDE